MLTMCLSLAVMQMCKEVSCHRLGHLAVLMIQFKALSPTATRCCHQGITKLHLVAALCTPLLLANQLLASSIWSSHFQQLLWRKTLQRSVPGTPADNHQLLASSESAEEASTWQHTVDLSNSAIFPTKLKSAQCEQGNKCERLLKLQSQAFK
jgi:hypothetical protein